MKRLALVTGGTGYLGSALTERLVADGWSPVLLVRSIPTDVRPGVEYVQLDVAQSDERRLHGLEFDAAFHLAAARSGANLAEHLDATLVLGDLVQTLVCGQNRTANVVFAGSYWQDAVGSYGTGPLNEYSAAKQAFSALAAFRAAHDGVPHVLLHIGDVYGPGDTRPKFLPQMLDSMRRSVRLAATSGEQLVSFVHLDDVVEALLVAASLTVDGRPPVVEYTVAGPRFESLRQALGDVERVVAGGLPIDWGTREQRSRAVEQVDVPAALPGWTPRKSLAGYIEEELRHG